VAEPRPPEAPADSLGPGEIFGTRPARRPVRRVLVRLGQLALTVVVTWFILERLGPGIGAMAASEVANVTPRWAWIAAACLLLAAGYATSALIWGRMVRDLGGPRLAPADAVRIYLVANLGRYVPGKLWQIAGLALLARGKGVPPSVATAAAFVGQAVALAGAMLIALIALAQAPPPLAGLAPFALVGTAAVVLVVTIPGIFRPLLRLWMRWVPGDAPAEVPIGALEGLRWLALYTLNWGGYALAFWLLMRGLSLPGSPLVLGPAFAAAYVVGYLALFAPAGLGVREGAMVVLLSPIVGAGAAALAAVVARVWTTVVEVVPAGAFWLAGIGRTRLGASRG
jgi:uncharacterized membrane protein YbhN (UPF0104 family)